MLLYSVCSLSEVLFNQKNVHVQNIIRKRIIPRTTHSEQKRRHKTDTVGSSKTSAVYQKTAQHHKPQDHKLAEQHVRSEFSQQLTFGMLFLRTGHNSPVCV